MRNIFLSAIAIVALAVISSCSKDSLSGQEAQSQNGPFEVSIKGELGEFAPSTKSTAESCIRMKWEDGDVVWAYDGEGNSLGGLTVSVEESDYIAVMTGTLSSVPSEGKIFLVHSGKYDQLHSGNEVYVNMSAQDADVVPFVAYAVVEGVTAAAQSNLKTKFHFATSVLKINATGIPKGAALTSATITNIETLCKLTISGGAFTVNSESSGAISKSLSGTASLGRASFYVGVPKFSEGTDRMLIVDAGGKAYYEHKVIQTAYAENNYINYIYDVKELDILDYIDENGVNRGKGTYMHGTAAVWAPVNCGYDDDHTYGLLYQWGRKYGQAREVGIIFPEALTKAQGEDPAYSGKFGLINNDDGNWFSGGVDNTLWNGSSKGTYDPCPTGWRVPTCEELDDLSWCESYEGSCTVGGVSQKGYWFIDDEGNDVFLPAAGQRDECGCAIYRGERGVYWSSSLLYGIDMGLLDTSFGLCGGYRAWGNSVRCVQE